MYTREWDDQVLIQCETYDCLQPCIQDEMQEAIESWNTRYEPICKYKAVCDEQFWETECGMTYECYDAAEPPNYCPNCGAKVVEE